jgi:hypothetical protein
VKKQKEVPPDKLCQAPGCPNEAKGETTELVGAPGAAKAVVTRYCRGHLWALIHRRKKLIYEDRMSKESIAHRLGRCQTKQELESMLFWAKNQTGASAATKKKWDAIAESKMAQFWQDAFMK